MPNMLKYRQMASLLLLAIKMSRIFTIFIVYIAAITTNRLQSSNTTIPKLDQLPINCLAPDKSYHSPIHNLLPLSMLPIILHLIVLNYYKLVSISKTEAPTLIIYYLIETLILVLLNCIDQRIHK